VGFLRSFAGVLVGYAIFAVSGVLLFQLSGQDPHGEATLPFAIGAIVYGIVFATLGGYVSGLIAGRAPFVHGMIVAGILALGATVSLIKTVGHGHIWSQVAALLTMAPAAALGGYLRSRSMAMRESAPPA